MFSADEQSHNNILTHCSLLLLFQGWYIVTYALAIYHLNLLLAFLTPKIDPAYAEFEAAEANAVTLHANINAVVQGATA